MCCATLIIRNSKLYQEVKILFFVDTILVHSSYSQWPHCFHPIRAKLFNYFRVSVKYTVICLHIQQFAKISPTFQLRFGTKIWINGLNICCQILPRFRNSIVTVFIWDNNEFLLLILFCCMLHWSSLCCSCKWQSEKWNNRSICVFTIGCSTRDCRLFFPVPPFKLIADWNRFMHLYNLDNAWNVGMFQSFPFSLGILLGQWMFIFHFLFFIFYSLLIITQFLIAQQYCCCSYHFWQWKKFLFTILVELFLSSHIHCNSNSKLAYHCIPPSFLMIILLLTMGQGMSLSNYLFIRWKILW